MALIYKFKDGGSVTKEMVNRNKPKENKTISKSERSNSESTSMSKPLVKSLKVLAIEKMMRDEKEQPVISQGRKLTEQEQKTSNKISKRLDSKKKWENTVVGDLGIDPTDIGVTAGNIAKKVANFGGEGLTQEDIIKTTNNPKEALEFANGIAKQEALNLIVGNILTIPIGSAYYNTAKVINKNIKNPLPSIKNFKKLHPLVTNSRLLDPALANKLIKKYPKTAGDIVGNNTIDVGDNIVKKVESTFNADKILDKAKQSAEKSELLERFSESMPQKKDALNELKLIKDIQSNLKHAEVESSMGDHIAKVHGKYYDTNKLSTEEYDLLEKAALNSPEQLAAYHTSYTPKETDAVINREASLKKSDFYTDKELTDKIKKTLDYEKKFDEFAEQYSLSDAYSVFKKKFPDAEKASNFQEKFINPKQYANVKSKLGSLYGNLGNRDITNPNQLKKIFSSSYNNTKAFDTQDFLKNINNEIFENTGKHITIDPQYLKSVIKSDEIVTPSLLKRMGKMKDFTGTTAIKNVSSNKKGGKLLYR